MDQPTQSPPLVTIIIPFYGTYIQYFEECLKSVIDQTYTKWEAIVVDDASTHDEAHKTVERFADPRVSYVRHERNRGQAAARNTGLRMAKGNFFMPVDCDDVLAPTLLEKLMQALATHPGCVIAYAPLLCNLSRSQLPDSGRARHAPRTMDSTPGYGVPHGPLAANEWLL